MGDRKLVTSEVAKRLGMRSATLVNYLYMHPDLRPAERLPNGDFLWTDEEIQACIERRARTKRGPKVGSHRVKKS